MLPSLSPAPPPNFDGGATAGTLVITAYLRDLRIRRGQSLLSVSEATGISPQVLARLEDAAGAVPEERVRALLAHLDAADADEVEELAAALRDRDMFSDWLAGADRRLAAVERAASHVRTVSSHAVPPIAQTPGYAETVAKLWPGQCHHGFAEADARRLADDDPRSVLIILSEALLRLRIGTRAVMEEQWAHLQDLMDGQRAEVRILPLTSEVHLPAPQLYELVLHGKADNFLYANPSSPEVVSYATGNNGAATYAWFHQIQAAALTPEDSFERLGVARRETAAW